MRRVSRLLAGARRTSTGGKAVEVRAEQAPSVVEVRAERASRPLGLVLAVSLGLSACTAGGPDAEVEVLAQPGEVGLAPVALGELPALDDPALDASVSRPRRDPVYPGVGHPVLDALHYDLDLAWDPEERLLTGRETLLLRVARNSDRLVLDLSPALEVSGVRLDGEQRPFDRRGQDLRVDAEVSTDDRHVLEIDYAGSPEPVAAPTTRGDFSTNGWTVTDDGDTWTMQEPTGAYSWYAVDDQPALGAGERALRDQPHLAVELHRLGRGDAQPLHHVEDGVGTHPSGHLGDGDADAGPGDGHQPGEHAERVGLVGRLLQGDPLRVGVGHELVACLLQPRDLRARPARGPGEAGEHVDEVLLAVAGVSVVVLGGLHLHDRGERHHREQHRDHDLGATGVQECLAQPPAAGVLVGLRGGRRHLPGVVAGLLRVGHGVGLTRGRGGAGWRPRWRRCGCRARR